jgi:hypothetical protein
LKGVCPLSSSMQLNATLTPLATTMTIARRRLTTMIALCII